MGYSRVYHETNTTLCKANGIQRGNRCKFILGKSIIRTISKE